MAGRGWLQGWWRGWWQAWLRFIFASLFVCLVALPALHRVWWDRHPGSEAQFRMWFPWVLMGALLLVALGSLTRFYVREYWDLFFNRSQEEHHGIQR